MVLSALVTGLAWAFSSPVGSSPDDDFHQASIWCYDGEDSEHCELEFTAAGDIETFTVPAVLGELCNRWDRYLSADCVDDFADGQQWTGTHLNRGSYPGGYYAVMSAFVGEDPEASVLTMRAVNVAITVTLLGLITALMPARERRIGLFTVIAASFPMGWFLVGSVNPSNWTVAGVFGTFLAFHGALTGTGRRRVALYALGVVAAVVALSSRGDAAAYTAAVAGMTLVLHYRTVLARYALGIVPFLVAAAGSYIFLTGSSTGYVIGQGESLVLAAAQSIDGAPDGPSWAGLLFNNLMEFPSLLFGSFGIGWGIGWLDTPVPALAQMGALGAYMMLAATGLRSMDLGKLAATLGLTALAVFLPVYVLQNRMDAVGIFLQPRYMYPLVVVILALVLVDRSGSARLAPAQAAAVFVSPRWATPLRCTPTSAGT